MAENKESKKGIENITAGEEPAKAEKAEKAADPAAGKFLVFDLNQRGATGRKHEVITKVHLDEHTGQPRSDIEPESVSYELYREKGIPMPMDHAMKFLCDPAFKVVRPDGTRIMPIPRQDPSRPVTNLAEDQIVVTYSELSHDALFARVKMIPGSEELTSKATKEELVAFMLAWRKHLKRQSAGDQAVLERIASGDLLDSQLPPDMAARLLPKSALLAA